MKFKEQRNSFHLLKDLLFVRSDFYEIHSRVIIPINLNFSVFIRFHAHNEISVQILNLRICI